METGQNENSAGALLDILRLNLGSELQFETGISHDPHEFMTAVHGVLFPRSIDRHVTVNVETTYTCSKCGRRAEKLPGSTVVPMRCLPLPLPPGSPKFKIQPIIRQLTGVSEIGAYSCQFACSSMGKFCKNRLPFSKFTIDYNKFLYDFVDGVDPEDKSVAFKFDHEGKHANIGDSLLKCNFATLKWTQWLDDEILNSYIQCLEYRDIMLSNELSYHMPVLFLNTFFAARLHDFRSKETAVARCVRMLEAELKRRSKTTKFDGIQDFSDIFFPVNCVFNEKTQKYTHWGTVHVDVILTKMRMVDSWKQGTDLEYYQKVIEIIKDSLDQMFSAAHLDAPTWEMEMERASPQQGNGFDCGVFCLMAMDSISIGLTLDFGTDDMQYFRKKIALTLLAYNSLSPVGLTPRDAPGVSCLHASIGRSHELMAKVIAHQHLFDFSLFFISIRVPIFSKLIPSQSNGST